MTEPYAETMGHLWAKAKEELAEALAKNERLRQQLKTAVWADSEECKFLQRENERLRAELADAIEDAATVRGKEQDQIIHQGREIERLRAELDLRDHYANEAAAAARERCAQRGQDAACRAGVAPRIAADIAAAIRKGET